MYRFSGDFVEGIGKTGIFKHIAYPIWKRHPVEKRQFLIIVKQGRLIYPVFLTTAIFSHSFRDSMIDFCQNSIVYLK